MASAINLTLALILFAPRQLGAEELLSATEDQKRLEILSGWMSTSRKALAVDQMRRFKEINLHLPVSHWTHVAPNTAVCSKTKQTVATHNPNWHCSEHQPHFVISVSFAHPATFIVRHTGQNGLQRIEISCARNCCKLWCYQGRTIQASVAFATFHS